MTAFSEADEAEHTFYSAPDHSGADYQTVLKAVHFHLKPKNYFEVGTQLGHTLAIASCRSLAVDPNFQVERNILGCKPACLLFQMASDSFFSQFNPEILLGGPIQLAFLDGMHWFEYLIRDFYNTEKYSAKNSIIMLHDCLPTDGHVARRNVHDTSLAARSSKPAWWAGDVWKAAAAILKYRPDLQIYGCNAAPTGLIIITNLDPRSDVLEKSYFQIVEEFSKLVGDRGNLEAWQNALTMIDASEFLSWERLSLRYWL